jgi:NADH:ubiquinone oxidoreductase subunit C
MDPAMERPAYDFLGISENDYKFRSLKHQDDPELTRHPLERDYSPPERGPVDVLAYTSRSSI